MYTNVPPTRHAHSVGDVVAVNGAGLFIYICGCRLLHSGISGVQYETWCVSLRRKVSQTHAWLAAPNSNRRELPLLSVLA